MVEELFPGSVSLVAEVDVYERVAFWLDGPLDEGHCGLLGRSASLLDVAIGTGANDVLPHGFSAHTPGDDVVERELTGGEAVSAILAFVLVAGEDVSTIEFYVGARQAVVEEQANDPRDGDVEIYG